ncbi:MAG: transglutaminase family protein, partial [Gemmataceae bacterium]|nr:transglutaminase family protein [Gemmataceae bacterium]
MSRRTLTSWLPAPKRTRRSRPWLGIEYLEDRTMPDASLPPDLVVGRTLSAYTVAGVQNRQLDITYTVYNQRADDLSGVLLTTALQPGVTYKSATAVPDRSGSELAWSLGTVRGFDRASVTVTVALPETLPLQIDSGAKAFATLNAGAVSADTPAAALSSRTIAPELLASTPDANTADPFVQEQAAKLRYDPARIVQYLSTDVGYESYSGSLRGSRGTLWSAAGNALDEASLGVALLRASGVPARYARGTLSDALSKQLILSMFPAGYQTVGYIPAGTTVADPADDPKLLAEARDHYWVQLDTGGGFVSADTSGLPGSGLGAAFTATSDTFAEVADGLRHKVGLKLNVEKYSSAGALFGFGNGLSTAPVLDRMFNTVDLVGRTLTVGHLVNEQSLGALVFSARTTTYSPFLIIGDAATGLAGDQVVNGTDYQDVRTNFPLGSQVVTGVFLDLTFAGPGRADRAARYTLADRVGPAARLGTATTSVSVDPNGPPLFGPVDLTTLAVLPGKVDPRVMARPASDIDAQEAAYAALPGGVPTDEPGRQALGAAVIALVRNTLLAESRVQLADFFSSSDAWATAFAGNLGVRAYHDGPRVAIVRATGGAGRLGFAIDLTKNDIRVLARPGQNPAAAVTFNLTRGMMDTYLETAAITPPAGSAAAPVGAHGVMAEAVARGVPFVTLTAANASELDGLPFPADVKALITRAVAGGKAVLVPDRPVEVGGAARLAWFEMDPATGESVGVLDDGTHGAGWLSYMGSLLLTRILVAAEEFGMGLIAGGIFNVTFLSIKSWKELAFKSASGGAGNAVSKALAIAGLVAIFKFGQTQVERLLFKSVAFVSGFLIASNWGLQALQKDPPVLPILIEPGQPVPPPPSRDAETVPVA